MRFFFPVYNQADRYRNKQTYTCFKIVTSHEQNLLRNVNIKIFLPLPRRYSVVFNVRHCVAIHYVGVIAIVLVLNISSYNTVLLITSSMENMS